MTNKSPIELSHVNVADNSNKDRTVYETLRHHRSEEDEYMTINTTLEGDTNKRQNVDKNDENIQKTLAGLAKSIKILKVVSIILASTVVITSVSFGVLLYHFVSFPYSIITVVVLNSKYICCKYFSVGINKRRV